MILKTPPSIVNFFRRFVPRDAQFAPKHIFRMLPSVLAGVVLSMQHSLTAIGGEVFSERRDKSTVSRMLGCREFRSRDLHWELLRRAVRQLAPRPGKVAEWHAALDGTSNQRGAFTRILGAILPKLRPEKLAKVGSAGKKGRRTKYHTFLVGTLTTHEGVRLALPRYTCDPTKFKRPGRPSKLRKTQLDLARLVLEQILEMLPIGVRLVVTADSYYESEKLITFAQRRGFTFITPLDSNRCFADGETPHKSNGHRIRDYGLGLPDSSFSRLDLRRNSEETASLRRYSERKPGPNDRRTYWLHHERRTVAKLGTVGIVCSWKTPVYEPKRNFRKKSFKILVCSDPTWSAEKIVEWYECRWTAIEIVIRELKQNLGLEAYTGQSLQALERYIDIVLMAFTYLELERHRVLNDVTTAPELRQQVSRARTLGMQAVVKGEANRQMLGAVQRSWQSQRPDPTVMAYVEIETKGRRPLLTPPRL